jgi:hypothetical protein
VNASIFSVARLAHFAARLAMALVAALLAFVLAFALAALRVKYPLGSNTPSAADPPAAGEIRGAFHIHSTLSDGRGTPTQIALAARAAGLQFIVMTDHNLRALTDPTYEAGVLVISGVELSTRKGHLVVIGASRGLKRPERDPDPVRHSRELGGVTILAHPVQRKQPWTDARAATRADGMELYSADSLFRDALRRPFSLLLPAASAYLTNPIHALMILDREQPEAMQKLLEISAREPKLAICAHDAHGWPPYVTAFRSFSVHIPLSGALQAGLPSNAGEAARAVIEAIARGRAYCVFDPLGAAGGFAIEGLRGESRRAAVGDRLTVRFPPAAPTEARVQVWGGARLEPDGRTVLLQRPGPIQIEVWIAAPGKLFGTVWKPWIVPSPILVVPTATLGTQSRSGKPAASVDLQPRREVSGSR